MLIEMYHGREYTDNVAVTYFYIHKLFDSLKQPIFKSLWAYITREARYILIHAIHRFLHPIVKLGPDCMRSITLDWKVGRRVLFVGGNKTDLKYRGNSYRIRGMINQRLYQCAPDGITHNNSRVIELINLAF